MSRDYMGSPEPVLRDPIEDFSDPNYNKALTWYHESLSRAPQRGVRKREMQGWLLEWMKNSPEFTQEDRNAVKPSKVLISLAIPCRILSNGTPFSPGLLARHVEAVKAALVKKFDPFARKETDPDAFQRSIQKKQSQIRSEFNGLVDDATDVAWSGQTLEKFDAFKYLMDRNVKPMIARAAITSLRPLLEELREYESIDEVRESYGTRSIDRARVNSLAAWVEQVLWDVERYCDTSTGKTPRKKKGQSAAKLVRRMQYLRTSDDYKVNSIDPTHIVGAQSVWLFNTKYRKLTELHAADTDGLTVSGSAIKGFDPKTSYSKVARKPEQVLPEILNATKGSVGRLMLNLKTARADTNGRTTRETVILRVVR